MCILCVVQRWSRRIATMLPWLLIPLLLFWAMSPFLPPGFRFEITSPRLACVMVLLVTLFWYEILMPQLSLWRTRRSARLRERRRALAIELQKLRKTATRHCRNCHTPYRDQNPGGGRFMCSYCGHVSKRPVLDLPHSFGSSGISELVRKNGWIYSQDWLAEVKANWVNPVPRCWVGDDQCSMEKSCPGVVLFARNLLFCFFASVRWLCRKVLRFSLREDGSDTDHRGSLSKRGDNGGNLQESRWEKARRKAEEKRQAKLEKEMLEEEERKQREEVARLVEERRRLRDEMLKAERGCSKGSIADGEGENRKEAENRRNEGRKDKDKGSTKSNSDVEDLEKRIIRVSERKCEFNKKNENERQDALRTMTEIPKSHTLEALHGNKVTTGKLRYFGHTTGNSLFSSSSSSGASFFGRNTQNPTSTVNKASMPTMGFMDHAFENRRDSEGSGDVIVKATSNGDGGICGSNLHQPLRQATPKKSWDKPFTRSAPVSTYPDSTSASCKNENGDAQSAHSIDQQFLPNYSSDNQINFMQPLPFNSITSANGAFGSTSVSGLSAESLFSSIKDPAPSLIAEEAEPFEDPSYVPDPKSLLGPVSEALDIFQLGLRAGFLSSDDVEGTQVLKNVSAPGNIAKPSPIESPISRLRVSEEKQTTFGQVSCISKSHDSHTMNEDESKGTWQIWGTPLIQDSLALISGSSSWVLPIGQKNVKQEEVSSLISHNIMTSQHANGSPAVLGVKSPHHVHNDNQQNGRTYSPHGAGMNASDPWMQKSSLQPLPIDGVNYFLPLSLIDNIQSTDTTDVSANKSTPDCSFKLSPVSCCFSPLSIHMKEWAHGGPQEDGISDLAQPNIGGLFPYGPDEESVWSFSQMETVQNTNETMLTKASTLPSFEEI